MKPTPEQIDAILPQTQCGLCGYKGCLPYAEALSEGKALINQCPPGGMEGLKAIANLLAIDPEPYLPDMEKQAKPPVVAVIREAECIGCTKCIQACPVDAILGMAKQMHTIITDECSGCELCVAPCPVDCIDMIPHHQPLIEKRDHYRARFKAREKRLRKPVIATTHHPEKKLFIEAALQRVKNKKAIL